MTRPAENPIAGVLLADASVQPHCPELMLFGQFVGHWDLDVRWFDGETISRRELGEWHFGWILGGRAVQDVWIVPPRTVQGDRDTLYEYGTSIRIYDPQLKQWQSTWHGPVQSSVRTFTARKVENEIILIGQEPSGRAIRWIFSDITVDHFKWRFERALEDKSGWSLVQSFDCARRRNDNGATDNLS